MRFRALVGSWLAYWIALAAVTLAPIAVAVWKVSRPDVKGSVNAGFGDNGVSVSVVANGGATAHWSVSLPILALALAGPPLALWIWWAIANSRRRPGDADPSRQLGSGAEIPLRQDLRDRERAHVRR